MTPPTFITTEFELRRLNEWIIQHARLLILQKCYGADGKRYCKSAKLKKMIAQAKQYAAILALAVAQRGK